MLRPVDTVCRRTARRWLGMLAVALAATLLAPAASWAVSDTEAVAMLNAQRALNGIPANLTVSPALSDSCAKHNAYIALNGGFLVHKEEPARPGYTAEGAGLAGGANMGEVLSGGPDYWDAVHTNPWVGSPLHLWLMFQPAGGATGYAADGRTACMRFALDGGAPAGVYSIPGAGAHDVPTSADTSREVPYSPADLVGVSTTQAGPPIVIWRVGGRADIARAGLTSSSGAAEVRIVDSRTPALDGTPHRFGSYVLPVAPLAAGTGYVLEVAFTDGATYRTTFTTAGTAVPVPAPGAAAFVRQTVTLGRRGRTLTVRAATPGGTPRTATIRFTSRTGRRLATRKVRLTGTRRITIPRGARKVTVTAAARGPYRAVRLSRRL
jgi:hypothetical protein